MKTILLLVALVAVAIAENPGMRIRITKHALDGFVNMMEEMSTEVMKRLPAEIKKEGNKRGRRKKVKVHKIEIKENENAEVDLSFKAPNQVVLKTSGGKAKVDVDMSMKKEGNWIRGKAKVEVADVAINVAVAFTMKEEGRLGIDIASCNVGIGTFNIEMEGFEEDESLKGKVSAVARRFKKLIPKLACPQLKMMVSLIQLKLLQHDMTVELEGKKIAAIAELAGGQLNNDYSFNYQLVSDPKATDDYLEFDMKGLFMATVHDRAAIVFEPHPIIDKADNSRMFYFFLSDEVPNQVFRELHHHGELDHDLPDNYNVAMKDKMVEHAGQMGWDILDSDKIEAKISFPEPPKVHFVEQGEKKHSMEIKGKFDLKVKHVRGSEVMSEPTAHVDVEIQHTTKVEDQEDKPYPKVTEKGKITKLAVTSIDDLVDRMDEGQKAHLESELKKLVQGAYDAMCEKVGKAKEREHDDMEYASIENATLQFFKHTMYVAFDIDIDVAGIFEKFEKDKDKLPKIPIGMPGGLNMMNMLF